MVSRAQAVSSTTITVLQLTSSPSCISGTGSLAGGEADWSHLQSEPVGSHGSGLGDVRSVPETSVLTDSPDNPLSAPDGLHHPLNLGPATALPLPRQLEGAVPVENLVPGTESPDPGQTNTDRPQPARD